MKWFTELSEDIQTGFLVVACVIGVVGIISVAVVLDGAFRGCV